MPDPRFDGRQARLQVHRVRPVYANGKCRSVPTRAAVLIHGGAQPGSPTFDLRHPASGGGELSAQKALARAGIDTFTPSLLGYGRSTRFDDGLNDPGNASLRPYLPDGSCPYPEGCDRTHAPVLVPARSAGDVAPDQSPGRGAARALEQRPLRTHRHLRTGHRQVIDDAIARAKPTDGKVALIGYSLGGQSVARTLHRHADAVAKVNRVVFLSSAFGFPTEETPPPTGFATFPLRLTDAAGNAGVWRMSPEREAACTGHVIPGSQEQSWTQNMEQDSVGRNWGRDDPGNPTGLIRSPVLSSYGWNTTVAGQLTTPALVIHGQDDTVAPPANAPASTTPSRRR
ncbi:alpha/beta fold hydrolase [Streptomyces sp. NPDC000410]|uniref:alpha/beta fold hydrolase n=1 Tax=Streptomyces sp. NPDC000410 TaxID=3154254 RepID=UPI00332A87A2